MLPLRNGAPEGIVNLKRISRILLLHVGDCAFLRATNGGYILGSSLKLTIPAGHLPLESCTARCLFAVPEKNLALPLGHTLY
jgi:hypothetical protein